MNTCIKCGVSYEYNSSCPKGCDSFHCTSCRKKNSDRNKKIKLFNIAGNGVAACRKCGYRKCVDALNLIDGVTSIISNPTKEQKEKIAEKQFMLCNNCNSEAKANEFEYRVTNSSCYPIEVKFYEVKVVIQKSEMEVEYNYGPDLIIPEIVN
jgi:hypothetical protein